MRTQFETERLILRELLPTDDVGMFALDSDPAVHQYLGKNTVTDIAQSREIITNIRQQYLDNGIGRWAVILKETNEFIGWSGLKLEKNVNGHAKFYDLGYRFIPKYWGKGYGYESAKAFVDFGFQEMKLDKICACFEVGNTGSQRIIEKCGLQYVNDFVYTDGSKCAWYELENSNK